ncbi:MAG: carboxyl transferase domain-containing protein, partial [Clostridiaceae bacterium]
MEEKKKFSAKDRSNFLFDDNSMFELGSKLCGDGAGVITGYGTINGKLVYYFSQDYSVKGGAVNSYNAKKICDVMDMAAKMGAPIVGIYDSCGAVLEEGLEVLNSYGEILKRAAKYSGVIPQIAVIAGPCTGTLAICASMSDFTIMVEDKAEMYITAPENYTEIQGEFISSKDYADYKVLGQNGTALLKAKEDEEALSLVKNIVKSIPSNNLDFAEDMPKDFNFPDVENYS